ncbi:MAG: hypothetical protein ACI9QR_001410 [Flavobacteriaceae bacterium]|jgi:hypothetical protein
MKWKEKGAIAKRARQIIVKERKSHQFAFNEMITGVDTDNKFIADTIAKTTSHKTEKRLKPLIWVFIISLSLVALLRMLGVIELLTVANVNIAIIIPVVLFSVVIPVIGIVASLTNKLDRLAFVGVMLLIGILRGFTSKEAQVEMDLIFFIVMIPVLSAIILSFYLPFAAKIKYSKVGTRQLNKNGKEAVVQTYTFEKETNDNSDILDSALVND